jgi:DNA-binding response OmpR family regulator
MTSSATIHDLAEAATRGVLVPMLTAADHDADRRRGLEAGADGYPTRPFSPLALPPNTWRILQEIASLVNTLPSVGPSCGCRCQ